MRNHRKAERWYRLLLASALAPVCVLAQSAPAESPLQLDQSIQQLKEQVLDLEQQAETLEQGYLYPTSGRVSFYVGTRTLGLLISRISLSLDGAAAVTYDYSRREGVALQDQDSLQRLISFEVAPGEHSVHADYVAQYADARPGDPPLPGQLDAKFSKGDGAVEVELSLGRDGAAAPIGLKLHQWNSGGGGAYVPGGADDPRLRSAEFLGDVGQYLSASALLLRIRNETPQQALAADFDLQLAGDTLDFGMPQRAEALSGGGGSAAGNAAGLARLRVRLADFLYQRGYYDRAAAELNAAQGQLPPDQANAWKDLMSRVLMAQERYGDAANLLGNPESAGKLPLYMRYNLGVALIHSGSADAGVKVLTAAGAAAVSPKDDDLKAQRDKINLALAYYLMRSGQGQAAVPIFKRVRDNGAFTDQALLGLGWAYLGPAGTAQPATAASGQDPFASLATVGSILDARKREASISRAPETVRLDKLSPERQAKMRQALVPWAVLVGHDPLEPQVQEGMLAIPYALDVLGAHAEAQQYYERAIDALDQTEKHLQTTMDYVRSGRMVNIMVIRDADAETGWSWNLRDLPGSNETRYLQAIVAENSFQESLKNYRDTRLLQRTMDTWNKHLGDLQDSDTAHRLLLANHLADPTAAASDQVASAAPTAAPALEPPPAAHAEGFHEQAQALRDRIAALQPALEQAAAGQRALLENVALADLSVQKNLTDRYLVESRLALARIYDSGTKSEQP